LNENNAIRIKSLINTPLSEVVLKYLNNFMIECKDLKKMSKSLNENLTVLRKKLSISNRKFRWR
jgi:hypothetical protein